MRKKPGFKTVLISDYEKMEKDLQEKEDTIQTLKQKVINTSNGYLS